MEIISNKNEIEEGIQLDQDFRRGKGTYRYWMFTWNNPPQDWQTACKRFEADYYIGQLEKGKNGTPHIQGLLYFKQAVRGAHFTKRNIPAWLKGISLEDARRVRNYSKKTDTRVEGPIEIGESPFVTRSKVDYETARRLAKENRVEEVEPSLYLRYYRTLQAIAYNSHQKYERPNVCGIWIFGEPGVGKSHYVRNQYADLYLKAQNKWFDGYNGQKAILIDDFDKGGECLGHYLKIWCDKWACSGEVKGGHIQLRHDYFIITSNYRPEEIWSDPVLFGAINRRFSTYTIRKLGGGLEDPYKYMNSVMNL